jgi:hypothetical protein
VFPEVIVNPIKTLCFVETSDDGFKTWLLPNCSYCSDRHFYHTVRGNELVAIDEYQNCHVSVIIVFVRGGGGS